MALRGNSEEQEITGMNRPGRSRKTQRDLFFTGPIAENAEI
jgi:hypothetical protein